MKKYELSEFEQARARKLGQELTDKIAQYFPEPPQDDRIAEVIALQEELEKMGFRVEWSVGVDLATGVVHTEVKLWQSTKTPEETDLPQD